MIIEIYDDECGEITEGQLFKASLRKEKNQTVVVLDSQE